MVYKNKTVRGTDLYKWIGKTIGVEDRIVGDVFNCLSDCIRIAISQGYDVSIPRVGVFTSWDKEGRKAGYKHSFGYLGDPKDVMNETDEYFTEWDEENHKYVRTFKKDQPNFRTVNFKFSPMLREKIREESKEYRNG